MRACFNAINHSHSFWRHGSPMNQYTEIKITGRLCLLNHALVLSFMFIYLTICVIASETNPLLSENNKFPLVLLLFA